MGPLSTAAILPILNITYAYGDRVGELRFLAHWLAGGDEGIETLMLWVGQPAQRPDMKDINLLRTLRIFDKVWDELGEFPKLRDDLAYQTPTIATKLNSGC